MPGAPAKLYLSGTVGDQFCVWPLDAPRLGVGRSSKNVIQLVDATVSKEHAEISRVGDGFQIRDLGSRNGTRVNGVKVREAVAIGPGDRLEIGHVPLRLTVEYPHEATRLSDPTRLSSPLQIQVKQVLDQSASGRGDSARMVGILAEAGRFLVLPRPLKQTCEEILLFVEKAVPASRLILLLQREPGAEPVQIAGRYRGGSAREPLVLSRAIMQTVLDKCTSVLTTDAAADPRFQMRHSIVSQAVRSAMAVPLFDNERVLGLLYADQSDPTSPYGQEQLEILTLLANMAAVKITNARLLEAAQHQARLEQELATATGIQRSLLPPVPAVEGYEFRAFLDTCYEVGGDLYDFHRTPEGKVYFLVGDVSGKGMGAALLMSSVLASARVLYDNCPDPADLARRLNAIMHRSTEASRFVTLFLGQLDPETGTLRFVNAGHNPPSLLSGRAVRELESNGVPIAVLPDFPYQVQSLALESGDVLAVFSDGIPEARREGEFFEERRLHEALIEEAGNPSLEDLSRKIIERVDAFLGGERREDDATLLLLRRA